MKPIALLLTASLVTNVAFLAYVATRPAEPTARSGSPLSRTTAAEPASLPAVAAPGDTAAPTPTTTRDVALGRAFARYQEKLRAARTTGTTDDSRWWRTRTSSSGSREAELLARRELTDALIAAFGDDLGLGGMDSSQLSFLSPAKRTALRNITQDYDEMMAKFGANGVQLASDKEKLRLLRAERDRDIAALLTPAELADYELRTSPSAATLRSRYGDAIASEEEFKKLYALQKSFDEKFPAEALTGRVTPDLMRARSEAQLQHQNDLRAAVGDQRYAALRRATDPELRTLDGLVTRLNLPPNTTDRVATARETYATESQRINADATLSILDRRAQLQALGTKAKTELNASLGPEVAEAFTPRASWLGMLQGGLAFSTTPTANSPGSLSLAGGPTQSVFPVMPAGSSTASGGAPGVRQVVNVISSSSETTGSPGGTLFLGGSPMEQPVNRTMQVISIGNPTHSESPANSTTVAPTPPATPKP
jgi:hypothetical protein